MPGPNCANGGMHLLAGVDRNRDGALGEDEVDPASNKFLCNGVQGPRGPEGAPGPQGEAGALALYGDGSAGDLFVSSDRQPLYLYAGYSNLSQGANLMFHNVTIEGSVIVASGTMIRATGDIIISPRGYLGVNPELQIETTNPAPKGIAMSGASGSQGGRGLSAGRAGILSRADLSGGGSGYSPTTDNYVNAGVGGPRLILAAKGNIIIRGTVDVAGRPAVNNHPSNNPAAPVAGGGGGGGGVVSLVSRGTITVDGDGKISANGGNGWAGSNPVAGNMYGGGGGGGGGIVQFLSSTPPVIGGAANVNVAAGAKGLANVSGTPTTLVQAGGGGGASGGSGGSGTPPPRPGAARPRQERRGRSSRR